MAGVLGIRRETKSPWERRVPLTPEIVRQLVEDEITVIVQPSTRRVFGDDEFTRVGATVSENLDDASIILGVKEVPEELFLPNKAYMFFSHVIKGQEYNMGMLQKIIDLGCTLIDYEKVCDHENRRLIFFGRFAGLAGMIDSLWTLGRRLALEGYDTPFATIRPAHEYDSLDDAKEAVRRAGRSIAENGLPDDLTPMVFGVTGYGNVACGAREILTELPLAEVHPNELAELENEIDDRSRTVFVATFREQDLVVPTDQNRSFILQEYYDHPERYRGIFDSYVPHISVLVNCNYWDERYPRLITKAALQEHFAAGKTPKLKVIGDLACDIEGAIECTVKATEPGDPVYVWDVDTQEEVSGVEGRGPVILAVDILPTELPRESSEEFTQTLTPFATALARADFSVPFGELDVPAEIKRGVIVHRGELTPDFTYLEEFLCELDR